MKRILSVTLLFTLILLAVLSASSFTVQSGSSYASADSSGAYTVDFSGTHAQIRRYGSRNHSASLDLSYPISAVCTYHNKIVLFCDDSSNNQLIVYVYYLNTDLLDSFAIYGAELYGSTDFCCDDESIFLEDHRDNHEVKAYSYSGKLMKTYRFDAEITALISGYQSGIYAVGSDRLYALSGDRFTALSGSSVDTPLFPADSHILASAYGSVYVLDGDRITDTFAVDSDFHASSACVIGNRLYYADGRLINGYDIDSGKKVCYYKTDRDIRLLYADGTNVIAVGESSSITVNRNGFTEIKASEEAPADEVNHSGGNSSALNQASDKDPASEISSDVYQIDFERYHITGISSGTTVAQFRSNIRYSGYSLAIHRDNEVRKSGNVGTAMTAVFTSSNDSLTFELAVDGDLTGEGNRNSRDLNLLMDYLIGAAQFNGVYEIAADISGDHIVDVVDLALLKSHTK